MIALSDMYDDGGLSGGTIERPALKRLLEDIKARKVRIVVVYKVDRIVPVRTQTGSVEYLPVPRQRDEQQRRS